MKQSYEKILTEALNAAFEYHSKEYWQAVHDGRVRLENPTAMMAGFASDDERKELLSKANESFYRAVAFGIDNFAKPGSCIDDRDRNMALMSLSSIDPKDCFSNEYEWVHTLTLVRMVVMYRLFPLNTSIEIDGRSIWNEYMQWFGEIDKLSDAVSVDDPSKLGCCAPTPPLWWRALRVILTPVRLWKRYYRRWFEKSVDETA